jgi:hypothetical protein
VVLHAGADFDDLARCFVAHDEIGFGGLVAAEDVQFTAFDQLLSILSE